MGKKQMLFNPLPAVVIGGPPHSGKSVLAYSLSQALRERGVGHYLLRAYPPDGEGDWTFAPAQETVRPWRVKGSVSTRWIALLRRDLQQRQLPLLVDFGGLPTPEQETLLDVCTHSLLLSPDEASAEEWRARLARHGLIPLAELQSSRKGTEAIWRHSPVLCGTMVGLERGQQASGSVFVALVRLLEALFQPWQGLRSQHLQSAPPEADLVLDLDQLARTLQLAPLAWQPEDLPQVLDYLPGGQSLALYGRAPDWLYGALAALARPARCFMFDPRRGWLQAPRLQRGPTSAEAFWTSALRQATPAYLVWHLTLPDTYLDPEAVNGATVALPEMTRGVILSGKSPLWLWLGIIPLCSAPWLALAQPQLAGSVVIASQDPTYPVGRVLSGVPAVPAAEA